MKEIFKLCQTLGKTLKQAEEKIDKSLTVLSDMQERTNNAELDAELERMLDEIDNISTLLGEQFYTFKDIYDLVYNECLKQVGIE